jgi:hypothetical protein
MKKASTGKTSSKAKSGPSLSAAQQVAKDIAEARNEEARSARATARSKRAAASAGHEAAAAGAASRAAASETAASKAAAARGNSAEAAQDAERARQDTSRVGQATSRTHEEQARSKTDAARARTYAARARADLAKARTVGLARAGVRPDGWVLGGNDRHDGCAAAAVANSLLACTGHRATDDEVLELYLAASGGADTGASILATLEAAARCSLGGVRPSSWSLVEDPGLLVEDPGLLVELDLQEAQRDQGVWDWEPSAYWGAHAGVLVGGEVVTWGQAVPVTPAFLAGQVPVAWRVNWPTP